MDVGTSGYWFWGWGWGLAGLGSGHKIKGRGEQGPRAPPLNLPDISPLKKTPHVRFHKHQIH